MAAGGIFVSSAALLNYLVNSGCPVSLSFLTVLVFSASIGLSIELFIYRHLRRQNASSEMFLLASFGVLIIIERVTMVIMGTMPLYLARHKVMDTNSVWAIGVLSHIQILSIFIAVLVAIVVTIAYSGSIGQKIVAVRQSALLFDWRVGDSVKFLSLVSAFSGSLVGLSAVLFHLQHRVVMEQAAMGLLIPVFIVVLASESINKWIVRVPLFSNDTRIERGLLVLLYFLTSVFISLSESMITIEIMPVWKDSILLLMAIIALVIGRKDRMYSIREDPIL